MVTQFVNQLLEEQIKVCQESQGKQIDLKFVESLLSMNMREQAYKIIEKCNFETIRNDRHILGIYLNLLAERDVEKALQIQ
mmetsp:Transcript_4406/g.7483  ORF Transcript_4406/g.7483 Transcript_4406/m.7483 type:complete len:81 (-) Transcript_4406:480-722(-)